MNTVKKIDFLIELANQNQNSLIEKELKTIRRQLAREKMQISYFIKNLIWFLEEETVTEKIDFELFSIMYKNFMHHDLLARLYELDWKLEE